MDILQRDIRTVKGVGEARAKAFAKLGITNIASLLEHYPRSYIDHRAIFSIAGAHSHIDEYITLTAYIAAPVSFHQIRRGLSVSKVRITDESGSMQLTYFNNPYIKNTLRQGEIYLFYGKIIHNGAFISMTNPLTEPYRPNHCPQLRPVYALSAGISQKMIQSAIAEVLPLINKEYDPLPESIRQAADLCTYYESLQHIHQPQSEEDYILARKRITFSELFYYMMRLEALRSKGHTESSFVLRRQDNSFVKLNSFTPTAAQKRVIQEIRCALSSGFTMNRLLQGDVGSGKTFVAGDALWQMMYQGYQTALMAPTEILAAQHYQYFAPLFEKLGKKTVLLTGSIAKKRKQEIYLALANGEIDFAVGTHALIQKDVTFKRLGLVITDEQHRFGVMQRSILGGKGSKPHILAMSATPIPRTMALILYGDLDISVIDERPAGRQTIKTYLVNSTYNERLYNFMSRQLSENGQIYYVCPLVEENEDSELTSVTSQTQTLQSRFGKAVAMIHGKMKPKEKEAVMAAFMQGIVQILVSTTVIEVGIDVPNATLMIIQDADRFGLSQLHQLRGRVGRGKRQSYCVLISDTKAESAQERMRFFCSTNDGFAIAQKDLLLRGPGDLTGTMQSGEDPASLIARLCDMRQVETAQQAARGLFEKDPGLNLPEHQTLKSFLLEKFNLNGDIYS